MPGPPATMLDQAISDMKKQVEKEVIDSVLKKSSSLAVMDPTKNEVPYLKEFKYPGVPYHDPKDGTIKVKAEIKKKKVVPQAALKTIPKSDFASLGIEISDEEMAVLEAEAKMLKAKAEFQQTQKEIQQKLKMVGTDGKLKIDPAYYTTLSVANDDFEPVKGPEPVKEPGDIPVDQLPPDMAFVPLDHPPKPIKPLALDPNTFKLLDPNTGLCVEDQLDAKTLGILKGDLSPDTEGYELGQYPGPPIVSAKKLKMLAGDPHGPIPKIMLSIAPGHTPDGEPCLVKKTVVKGVKGTKVYTTPIYKKKTPAVQKVKQTSFFI